MPFCSKAQTSTIHHYWCLGGAIQPVYQLKTARLPIKNTTVHILERQGWQKHILHSKPSLTEQRLHQIKFQFIV